MAENIKAIAAVSLMYGFINETYNPIKGLCMYLCEYCFMRGMRQRFGQDATLRLDEKELQKKLGKGKFIFVGSSTDEFAVNVPTEWIIAVLNHLLEYPENRYLLQSKNPARFIEFLGHPLFQDKTKVVFCTTLESDLDYANISQAPSKAKRVAAMQELSKRGYQTMVTVEPIMKFSSAANFAEMIVSCNPIHVNIGQNTARGVKLPEPTKEQYAKLETELAKRGLNIYRKTNLDRMI